MSLAIIASAFYGCCGWKITGVCELYDRLAARDEAYPLLPYFP
jgi:hypothetical protein